MRALLIAYALAASSPASAFCWSAQVGDTVSKIVCASGDHIEHVDAYGNPWCPASEIDFDATGGVDNDPLEPPDVWRAWIEDVPAQRLLEQP